MYNFRNKLLPIEFVNFIILASDLSHVSDSNTWAVCFECGRSQVDRPVDQRRGWEAILRDGRPTCPVFAVRVPTLTCIIILWVW